MDTFEDQNFGHILRDLGGTNDLKCVNSAFSTQTTDDENGDISDHKILTQLEIPKSKSQLNFCKSLTEKLKTDDRSVFSLTEIEPCGPVCSETKNDSYRIPNQPSAVIANEVALVNQERAMFLDSARQEILACLSDTPQPPVELISNINPTKDTPQIETNVNQSSSHISTESDEKITQPKFFPQKLKSSTQRSATKRKTESADINVRPTKRRVDKREPCLYHPGMIVWAKITGYSFWPAMVDNDPDLNSFTWPLNSSTTHYHVVFFDTNGRLSRSWVKPHNLKQFTEVIKISNARPRDYIERFKRSVKEAKDAMNLSLDERLKRYSFKERLKLPGTVLCQE